jgi:hypothetical protein
MPPRRTASDSSFPGAQGVTQGLRKRTSPTGSGIRGSGEKVRFPHRETMKPQVGHAAKQSAAEWTTAGTLRGESPHGCLGPRGAGHVVITCGPARHQRPEARLPDFCPLSSGLLCSLGRPTQ